jgi:ubiquinone biosynthesis protein UbiJ
LEIEGNLDLGQHITDLFDRLEIDWEEYISRYTGDVAAYQIGRIGKRIKKFHQHARSTLTQQINEYTHEEIQLVPAIEELNDFYHDVDELRMDVDRVESKIVNLKREIL